MDYNNPKPQSDAQILSAREALTSGHGTLPERVKLAHAYLFTCVRDGFEKHFDIIDQNLASVRNNDYSRVKSEELKAVVHAIEEMANEIRGLEAVALHERARL